MSVIDFNVRALNKATFFNNILKLDGDNNAIGDYSGGVTEFSYTNTSSAEKIFLGDLVIKIQDDGAFQMDEYGNIGTTLVNGLNIYYTSSTGAVRNDIVGTTYPVQKNSDYFNYTTDINLINNDTGASIMNINLNFQKNHSNVQLGTMDKIAVEVNDDFTNLTEHTFSISGFTYQNSDLI